MATYIKKGDDLVTCPYDPAHRLKRSRMQMHLAKCEKNHPELILKECPFNNIHRLRQHEFSHHLLNCPDRCKVDKLVGANLERNNPFKGHTGVPPYSEQVPQAELSDEIWETGADSFSYGETTAVPKGGFITDLGVTTRSQRKQIYDEASRADEDEVKAVIPGISPVKVKAPVQETEPRKPKQKSEERFKAMLMNGSIEQSTGFGRGQPRWDSRIAANIFSSETQQLDTITNGVQKLGMGRGNPGLANLACEDYDSNFPSLGMGRGHRMKK